jgi:hypothetical protein
MEKDYKQRMIEEYTQLMSRYRKLRTMLVNWSLDLLGFKPTCSYELLCAQFNAMGAYKSILEERMRIEHISLAPDSSKEDEQ